MKTHVIILGVNIQKRSTANAHKQKEGKNICLTKMNSNFPKRCEFNTVCITAQHTPITPWESIPRISSKSDHLFIIV